MDGADVVNCERDIQLSEGVRKMAEKRQGREIDFVETYDENVKKAVEKTFLKYGISYLIKVDKVTSMRKRHFESRIKYTFQINKFQQDEARAAIEEKKLDEDSIRFLA